MRERTTRSSKASAAGKAKRPVPDETEPSPPELHRLLRLQRSAGNRAVAGALVPVQRDPVAYEPGESETATARGVISPDVRLLAGTGSRFNAAANSVLVADFRPNSAVVRTSAREELSGSWTRILEGQRTRQYALLGFTDATGDEGPNQSLRLNRARAVAALLPGTAGRGVVGAAPTGEFITGNTTREERALNRAVLIRLPPEELREVGQVDRYSAAAVAFWQTHPTATVTDLVDAVSREAVGMLVDNGVPAPDVVPGTVPKASSTLAFFSAEDWQITLDTGALAGASGQAGVTPATTMAGLSVEAVAELSQACYHEARHAEQAFLAARAAAEEQGGATDPATLARSLGIRADVAAAAVTASSVVLPDVLRAKGDAWRSFMRGGRYVPYRTWNEKLKSQIEIFNFVFGPQISKWTTPGPDLLGAAAIWTIWEKGLHPTLDKNFRRDLSFRADALIRDLQRDRTPDPLPRRRVAHPEPDGGQAVHHVGQGEIGQRPAGLRCRGQARRREQGSGGQQGPAVVA
ncbi:hypothetical protein [Microlunatus sp. Gsoil 973]|uniref:hypothetical protein n=1 Tax=Microlunatus sp. Gsoil 973 TaxID=2672569 RepID=UPI0018A8009F|nr:hypothetical protein [Microlunatus sp. Gsoil 973]